MNIATATGRRTLVEIDGRPAAEVYNQWTEGLVREMLGKGGHILARTRSEEVAGALVVYCAGYMLSVQDRLTEVVQSIREALPGVPFLGTFTYGEQGYFLGGGNRHGNLMISVLLFTKG